MNKLTCEMCGSTDLMKQEGAFVCQTCGCKYSVEEARKMMMGGTVEVSGTVKVDNSAQIDNYLQLSENAFNSGNGQSAFDYANKALEIDPKNSKAWIAKMKAIENLATLGDPRVTEVSEAGKNAIEYAKEEEKDEIELTVYKYELTRALDLLKIATNKFADTADIKQTFKRFAMISLLSAAKNTQDVDSGVTSIYSNLSSEAYLLALGVPEEPLVKYPELAKLLLECSKQYQYVTDAFTERLKVYGSSLTSEALSARESIRKLMADKANKAIKIVTDRENAVKKAEADRRYKEYWDNHVEERNRLEKELESLRAQYATLKENIDKVPGKEEQDELNQQISALTQEKNSLGMFKGKEKKEIQAKIDVLNGKVREVLDRMAKEKAGITKEMDDLKKKANQIKNELSKER